MNASRRSLNLQYRPRAERWRRVRRGGSAGEERCRARLSQGGTGGEAEGVRGARDASVYDRSQGLKTIY